MSNSGRKHINVGLFRTHISFSPYLRDIKKSCVVGGVKKIFVYVIQWRQIKTNVKDNHT
eukprot:UN11239